MTNETKRSDGTPMKVKLFNTKTGLWYRVGANITEPCEDNATSLEPQQASVVRATFDNVGQKEVAVDPTAVKIVRASEKRKGHPGITAKQVGEFLERTGWTVQMEMKWCGSSGRKSGRLRSSDGHDRYGWELTAAKGDKMIVHNAGHSVRHLCFVVRNRCGF